MGLYIRNMKMPQNCDDCQLNYDYCACILTGSRFYKYNTEFNPSEERLSNCPLTPVPSHGDLIDRNTLKNVQQADADLFKGSNDYGEKCRYDEAINAVANIINAPTIIPAEEE